jgi:hypothetical protein
MTATNKETWATILARVSKVDKEVNPGHGVETWETRINKAVLTVAASKGSKEVRQIVEVSKARDSKVRVRKAEFPLIAALLH